MNQRLNTLPRTLSGELFEKWTHYEVSNGVSYSLVESLLLHTLKHLNFIWKLIGSIVGRDTVCPD
jgi:hypothetical protein